MCRASLLSLLVGSLALIPASLSAAVITDGLQVYLPLDGNLDNLGPSAAVASFVSTGTPAGPPAWSSGVGFNSGQSLNLAGNSLRQNSNGTAVGLNYTLTDSGTIALWHYARGPYYNYSTIYDNSVNADDWEFWVYNNGNIGARVDGGALQYGLGASDDWHHFAFAWERDDANPNQVQVQVYVDGVLRHNVTQNWVDPGSTFYLAGGHSGNSYGDGMFDELYIFDRALSLGEINLLMDTALAPEPGTWALGAIGAFGVAGLLCCRQRRKKQL